MRGTLLFIGCCWAIWLAYWVLMAFRNKRTVERGNFLGYRAVALGCVAALFGVSRLLGIAWNATLWHTSLPFGVLCAAVVVAGLAFSVWARVTLGGNWSAEVTFKRDHVLIRSGPYALVRHPIYTGMLAMALGPAIDYGRFDGLAVLVALCAALWWKARQEERMMSAHFGDAYADYRAHVRSIIPFVL